MEHDEILTADEVATDLRCSRGHVYKMVRGLVSGASRLPAIFMGRKIVIRRSALEQWKADNEARDDDAKLPASFKVGAVDA